MKDGQTDTRWDRIQQAEGSHLLGLDRNEGIRRMIWVDLQLLVSFKISSRCCVLFLNFRFQYSADVLAKIGHIQI